MDRNVGEDKRKKGIATSGVIYSKAPGQMEKRAEKLPKVVPSGDSDFETSHAEVKKTRVLSTRNAGKWLNSNYSVSRPEAQDTLILTKTQQ